MGRADIASLRRKASEGAGVAAGVVVRSEDLEAGCPAYASEAAEQRMRSISLFQVES